MTASPSETARGATPKRQRGIERVAAILQASTTLILDKGYDAVTMTEIAASSGTAIGSLYRFFPSKEAVADALLRSYTERLGNGLLELRDHAAGMSPRQLADALVDFMLGLRTQRSVAIALVDARGLEDSRRQLRAAMLADIGALLRVVLPAVDEARLPVMAAAVLQVLKGVAQSGPGFEMAGMMDEYRRLIGAYLETV